VQVTVRVKICGITRREDALEAVRLGADALGFNFWPGSRRFIAPVAARAIVRALPPFVTAVGVFVDAGRDELLAAAAISGVRLLQLHGDEPPALGLDLPLPVLKAVRVNGPEALAELVRWPGVAGFLLDAPGAGYGGSGRTFDWSVAAEAARRATVVLAGGLTAENVGDAVRAVRPFAVDVASGVESAPGVKDPLELAAFIAAAKQADHRSPAAAVGHPAGAAPEDPA
jgi:phosphoribosylanthranilate isomerase